MYRRMLEKRMLALTEFTAVTNSQFRRFSPAFVSYGSLIGLG